MNASNIIKAINQRVKDLDALFESETKYTEQNKALILNSGLDIKMKDGIPYIRNTQSNREQLATLNRINNSTYGRNRTNEDLQKRFFSDEKLTKEELHTLAEESYYISSNKNEVLQKYYKVYGHHQTKGMEDLRSGKLNSKQIKNLYKRWKGLNINQTSKDYIPTYEEWG